MSDGRAGRGSLSNEVMDVEQHHGGQNCNGGTAGEHRSGNGLGIWGCGIWKGIPHSSQAEHTVTRTITQSASRAAPSTVTSILSSAAIPPASSIISLFSSAAASSPQPSTSILSRSQPIPLSEASIPTPHPTTSTRIPLTSTQTLETILSSLQISSATSTGSAKESSKTTLLTSKVSTTPLQPSAPSTTTTTSKGFVTALSITAPYPSTLAPFFPSQTPPSNNNPLAALLPQGLGPESASGRQSSQEGGIIAGVLLGVLFIVFIAVTIVFRRYKKSRQHRQSIGSFSLNGDYNDNDDRIPILGWRRRSSVPSDSYTTSEKRGSLRTKNRSYSRPKLTNANRRDTAPPTTGYSNRPFASDLGMSGALPVNSYSYPHDYEGGRPVTLPAPAFAPLRANRSSSVYSGSILNALSSPLTAPIIPAKNPRRGVSLNFSFNDSNPTETPSHPEIKRSASEPWKGRGIGMREIDGDREEEQWPRTIEDFKRMRNLGDNMRRGRPGRENEGEKSYGVLKPDFGDEEDGGEVVRVYKESWGGNPFVGRGSETGIVPIGLGFGSPDSGVKEGEWKDSGLGRETWYGNSNSEKERRDSGKELDDSRGGGGRYVGGYGGFDFKDEVVVNERAVDANSVFSAETNTTYEELRKGYKGMIRFGMGVQRRLTAESRFKDLEGGMI